MVDEHSTEQAMPRVLIVAGSDSGGGAGIQADIKAVTMLGGFAMTAVTAITAQNTHGVSNIWPMPVEAVQAQINAVLSDLGADVIKTGMLGATDLIEALADQFDAMAKDTPKVIDPVMVASSGDRLLPEHAIDAVRSTLIPGATLVTPNSREAEILTGKAVETVDGQRRAAEQLLELGADAALVKGGHVGGAVITDVLQTQYDEFLFEADRIESRNTHGTGCTLASATAALIGSGKPLSEAVPEARDYVWQAIKHASGFGSGHNGPLRHNWALMDKG